MTMSVQVDVWASDEMIPLLLMIAAFAMLFTLAIYVVTALGYYRMAKKLGVDNAFLAFIPVASQYLIGQIAEVGASATGKKSWPWRYILLLPYIGLFVLSFVMGVTSALSVVLPIFAVLTLLLALVIMPVTIAVVVFNYMALWYIFKLFDEGNAVLYLVLSIFFSVAMPIIILILSGKTPMIYQQQSNPNDTYDTYDPSSDSQYFE